MVSNRADDITRLLSLQLEDIAGEMGHTPEEAKAIIDLVVAEVTPKKLENVISGTSSGTANILGNMPIYDELELKGILDRLTDVISADEIFLDDIRSSRNPFFTDSNGNNILMKMAVEGNVQAVKYLVGFPFDYFHINNEGFDVFDFIRIFTAKNHTDGEYKERVKKCKEIIYEVLADNPSLKFILRVIKDSANFHQYEEQYKKLLVCTDNNGIVLLVIDLLKKASLVGDIEVANVLVSMKHQNRKHRSASGIREVFYK